VFTSGRVREIVQGDSSKLLPLKTIRAHARAAAMVRVRVWI